jgi:hypothetical protein
MQFSFTIRRVLGVWALCGFAILTACNKPEQSPAHSPHGVAIRGEQSSLAEATILMVLLAANKAHKKSAQSANEPAQPEIKKAAGQKSSSQGAPNPPQLLAPSGRTLLRNFEE